MDTLIFAPYSHDANSFLYLSPFKQLDVQSVLRLKEREARKKQHDGVKQFFLRFHLCLGVHPAGFRSEASVCWT